LLEEIRAEAEVARTIYRLRNGAKLTQQALAERVGTTASVISRLEDADYTGHSLAMLRRIAAALGRRVEIRFPAVKTAKTRLAKGKPPVRSGNGSSRSKSRTSSI
jgi:transcriptional regulator with XRE-family HTH domain